MGSGMTVVPALRAFVQTEALPGTGIAAEAFWAGFAAILSDLVPRNLALLARRDELQAKIDAWHKARAGQAHDAAAYAAYLREIGYLLPAGPDFAISTANVDAEIATIAGPQLVVPVMNARYALNAANARWGSLYDALYGTDAIPEDGDLARGGAYNPARGARVIAFARSFLDQAARLAAAAHADVARYAVQDGQLVAHLKSAARAVLADATSFAGYRGAPDNP